MTANSIIETLEKRLSKAKVDNARRVCEELIANHENCRPLEIYLRPLSNNLLENLEPQLQRIELGEPLQYIIGHVDFFGLTISCDPRALIPRPETEFLVEEILQSNHWRNQPQPRVIEVGTGSGCIIISLAHNHPTASFKAIDLSKAALELAQENARHHQLSETIIWENDSLLDHQPEQSADIVVANLPYISTADWRALHASVRDHEPRSALDSGPSGMELIEELALQALTVLRPGGELYLEFGFDQGRAVETCLAEKGYQNIQIKPDLAGLDRMAIATRP